MINLIDYDKVGSKAIKSKLDAFGYWKITVMFNSINYLFFDYELREDMHNTVTVENFHGETLMISGLNCGYGGHGPSDTKEFLITLGIEDEEADRLRYLNGFQVVFGEDGQYLKGKGIEGLPFESRNHQVKPGQIQLHTERMIENLSKKQLYFIEPREASFLSLIDTLSLLKIRKMNFYIGKENGKYFDFSLPYLPANYQFGYRGTVKQILSGPFIYFDAIPFDVICFLGKDCPGSMINTLAIYVSGHPVFQENRLGGQASLLESKHESVTFLSRIRKFFSYLGEPKDLYRSIDVGRKGRGRLDE